jgi:hypothetical protein
MSGDPKKGPSKGQGCVMSMDRMVGAASNGGAMGDFVEYGRPAGAIRVRRGRWPLRSSILLAVCLVGGVILARGGRGSIATPVSHPSQIDFVANDRLAPMLSFGPPEAVRGPTHYQARLRENSDERWDTLTFGDAGADELLFRVTLRLAKSAVDRSSLFVELAKQSAELGAAVVHATSPQFYVTQRGPIEWADMTLAGPKGERSCLGFRFGRAQALDLSGLACGGHGSRLDRVALGHLIDRLSATDSGMEAGLGEILKSGAT